MEKLNMIEMRSILKEAHDSYKMAVAAGGNMNEDFASFAARWIEDCRSVLNWPCLSKDELASLIRRAQQDKVFNKLASGGPRRHIASYINKHSPVSDVVEGTHAVA